MTDDHARESGGGLEDKSTFSPPPLSRPAVRKTHLSESADKAAANDRALAAWEIVSVTLSVLIAEWVVLALADSGSSLVNFAVGLFAFTFMLLSKSVRKETARDLGWRFDNFPRAMRLLALPTLAMTTFLLLAGALAGSIDFSRWRGGWAFVGVPTFVLAWALVQQYALQAFINRRAQIICGRGPRSVVLVSAVFALAHFPNPALTAVTFAGGLVWAAVYQRAPNLPALAVSHALMTWVLVSTLPPQLLGGLRVGYKYFG
ncbi:MAG TPA: CPBP family intramembrane glutamic endopeptidase [Pyrinomonadaceae bacterium]